MSAKTVYFIESQPPLTRDEIAKLFGKMHERDPVPRALRQIVQERIAQATSDNTNPKMTEREAGHAAGRLTELLDLATELTELVRAQPKQKPATTGNT
jgi:hypothetical protein